MPERSPLRPYPPPERWDDWVELDSQAWPRRVEKRYALVPTTCFNCESACGLLAYVDKDTGEIRKLEGNPEHPGSRGRNCAKGPATLNQIQDPDRILYPLKRVGERGGNGWERVSWDEALDDIAARIRKAIVEGRPNEVMYHVGRPGEDGYTERVLAAWGVDGHNSHTNICSSSGRAGYQFWMGLDRPSPDHANADVILLISAHLESGHYFNPHAQRIMEAKARGAKLIVFDVRLSNTATHADHWLAPYPGSEAAMLLAIARHLIETGALRPRVRAPLVELAGVPAQRAAGHRGRPSRTSRRRCARPTRATRSTTPRRSRASTPQRSRRSRAWWPGPARASRRTTGAAPPPATSAAGRCRGACSCSTRCSARSRPKAARSRTRGTSSCRGRSTRRRIRRSGTS